MNRGENSDKQKQGQLEALQDMIDGKKISLKTPNSPKKQGPFNYGSASPKGKS